MHVQWYATVFRADLFVDAVSEFAAPASLAYGAKRYSVQRSQDDHYRILQAIWFYTKDDWYRYWEGPELIEFRARYAGKYQIPIVYVWHDELAADQLPTAALNGQNLADPPRDPEPRAAV